MMYMGSKAKLAKHILPILQAARSGPEQFYVEPFVGGANMIDKMTGPRIGNDLHPELIAMWKALCAGWIPPSEVSRELYTAIRKNPSAFPTELVGFVGFLCSFGGKWWGGYAANTKGDNYAERGARGVLKQVPALRGVQWFNLPYSELHIPESSLVYLDPPYAGTTEYRGGFDHNQFWEWVRALVRDGHTCFISEYSAPSDFQCVL